MATTKTALTAALDDLKSKEFKRFKWQLSNPATDDMKPIPRSRLEDADHLDVVDLMVQQYSDEAGAVAVNVLHMIGQNDLAKKLERWLQEAQQLKQENGRSASVSERQQQLIQSDWKRPDRINPCTQEFKDNILRDEIYKPTSTSRKGTALLITNIHSRPGAEIDEENMEWLLTGLGYRVEKHRNLSAQEIDAAVKNFAESSNHEDSDSTFVVIMSHGDRIENKDAIFGVSNQNPDDVFFVEDIFSHLNSENCPDLIDKPKVILIQSCRGDHPGGVQISDGALESDAWVHKEKDFVCFMSSVPDTRSYRNANFGSYFINYIVQVFCEWAHNDEIMELFRKVSSCMENRPGREENKLLSCLERATLTKKFYLFPEP